MMGQILIIETHERHEEYTTIYKSFLFTSCNQEKTKQAQPNEQNQVINGSAGIVISARLPVPLVPRTCSWRFCPCQGAKPADGGKHEGLQEPH